MLNQVAVITGSSRGIGAATARLMAAKGYSIVLNYQNSAGPAEALKQEISAMGVPCIAIQADVSEEDQVEVLFAEADALGPLAVLVNNAGILAQQTGLRGISAERFRHILNVNVLSCFLCTKAAATRMSTKEGGCGGTIVNVSSTAAKSGAPNEYTDYAASKGAMDSFTRGAALELSDEGIRVNAVRPALIDTQMHASGGEPDRVKRLQAKIPLQRPGTVQEVAEAIVWLATNKSSFVTGSFIDASGGLQSHCAGYFERQHMEVKILLKRSLTSGIICGYPGSHSRRPGRRNQPVVKSQSELSRGAYPSNAKWRLLAPGSGYYQRLVHIQ